MVHVHNHHHVEISLDNGLADIQDINVVVGQVGTHLCNNTDRIMSYYCNNCLLHQKFLRFFRNFSAVSRLHLYAISIKRDTSLRFAT
jgi:hypothetical protein